MMKLTTPERNFAEFHGYEIKMKGFDHFEDMTNGNRKIWLVLRERYRYDFQTADLIDGVYKNHKKFKDFHEAVTRPLTK